MSAEIKQHPIRENRLQINNDEYFALNISKIIVGVENSEQQEIVKDSATGLNYTRNAVEGVEIYNINTQKHRPWFVLDLETGSRGWFPGCHIHADIRDIIEIKKEPDVNSDTLMTVSNVSVRILDISDINEEPATEGWYKIRYTEDGYVMKNQVTNIRYEKPF